MIATLGPGTETSMEWAEKSTGGCGLRGALSDTDLGTDLELIDPIQVAWKGVSQDETQNTKSWLHLEANSIQNVLTSTAL